MNTLMAEWMAEIVTGNGGAEVGPGRRGFSLSSGFRNKGLKRC